MQVWRVVSEAALDYASSLRWCPSLGRDVVLVYLKKNAGYVFFAACVSVCDHPLGSIRRVVVVLVADFAGVRSNTGLSHGI